MVLWVWKQPGKIQASEVNVTLALLKEKKQIRCFTLGSFNSLLWNMAHL